MTTALEISGLTKRFGGLRVIDGVSLTLQVGARHALIGPNGAGKTTLVSLLSGVLAPDEGRVVLLGRDMTRAAPQARVRRGLVRTFQVNSLFNGLTLIENILIALGERTQASRSMLQTSAARKDLMAKARELIDEVGLGDYTHRKIVQMPYGPQRLVEIAIALALEPKVLLLDEPAAGIPAADATRLLAIIDKLPAEIAILMIEHDMHVVRRFAREATVLVSGSVLMTGAPEEVLSSAEVRRVYLGKDRGGHPGAMRA